MKIFADEFGSSDNFSIPMIEAVKSLNSGDTLVFSDREYHFYRDFSQSKVIHMTNTDSFKNPQKFFAMLFENLDNITIEGNGATFCIHGDMCSMAILNCNNFKLRDFTINYPSPSNVELTVKAKKGKKVLFEIPEKTLWYLDGKDVVFFEQSPFTKKNYWQFKNDENSHNGVLHSGNDVFRTLHFKGPFSKVKSAERKSMTELEINYKVKRKFEVGETYTFSQNKNRNTCGLFVNESSNIDAQNITVNYLPGFGWLSQMCENVSFNNVTFKPDDKHHVSAFADLIHICGCKGDVKITNCYFSHPHDDPINIHGSFLRFKEKKDNNTAVFEFIHKQQGGYRAFNDGDKVKFYYRSNLQELDGEYTVASAVDDIDAKTVTVKFNAPLPAEIENKFMGISNIVAENITYCPNVEIADCEFTAIPTRGILCTTAGKVRIHDNKFSHTAMAHIFISNDAADWYESGPVRDVEIYSNYFYLTASKQYEQLNAPGVLIYPITSSRRVTKPIHQNIRIHSNYFQVGRDKPIKAIGVKDIDIYGNVYEGSSHVKLRHCTKAK
ncbi:MAG: hypothetical protein ACLUFN_09570 [Eubacterium sp.]